MLATTQPAKFVRQRYTERGRTKYTAEDMRAVKLQVLKPVLPKANDNQKFLKQRFILSFWLRQNRDVRFHPPDL